MAFANSAITDIIATTIQSRSGELADNLTQNNAILQRLQQLVPCRMAHPLDCNFSSRCHRLQQLHLCGAKTR